MSILTRRVNPVLSRELTERMRGPRAMVMLSVYLLVLSGIVILVYRTETGLNGNFGAAPVTRIAAVGQGLFEWTLFFVLLLVLFLVPGFTAGSIAGERERQTLLPMQVTLLRPINIVLGKIGSSVAFTLLLVVATMPLLTVAYLIGGVTIADIAKGLALVMFTAVAFAAISVFCSTFMKRVQTATVLSYGVVLMLAGGTLAAFGIAGQIDASRGPDVTDPPLIILAPNPVVALADITGDARQFGGEEFFGEFGGFGQTQTSSPLVGLRGLLVPENFEFFDEPARALGEPFGVNRRQGLLGGAGARGGIPLWGQNLIFLGTTSALAVVLSARRLRTPAKTER